MLSGDLKTRELADVLLTASRESLTGILAVKSAQEVIGLSFSKGFIVGADCLSRTMEEGLGELLIKADLVSREDLAAILIEHEEGGKPLTRMLVDRGFLDQATLVEVLRSRAQGLCLDALRWQDGDFKFYPGDEVAQEEDLGELRVEQILLRAAEEVWESSAETASVPTAESVYRRAAPEDLKDAALRGVVEAMRGGMVDAGFEGKLILELVDGRSSAAELAQSTGLAVDKVRLTLYLLRRAGQVAPVEVGTAAGDVSESQDESRDDGATEVDEPQEPIVDEAPTSRAPGSAPAVGSRQRESGSWSLKNWPARIVAAGLVAGAILLAIRSPLDFLMPHGWQESWRQELRDEGVAAKFFRLESSARTFYLLEGRYPATAREFEERYLISARDLEDPAGGEFLFSSGSASYQVARAVTHDGSDRVAAGSIAGHFLLDPEIVEVEVDDQPALVLLD